MNRVVDLTAGDSEAAEVLERTGSGGVLGSTYLHDDPLGAYLAPDEEPKWILRNKQSGVAVEGGTGEADLETRAPGGGYQAFALVTDVRILFVVGDESGDTVQPLPLADVIAARTESGGFRTNVLRVETQADAVVTFPVTAALEAPAEYVDHAAQVWAHAARTAEDIAATVERADASIEADDFEAAGEAVAGVEANLEAALGDLRELGQGALTAFISLAEDLVDDVSDVRRRAHAGRGAAAHARAQAAWDASEYVEAATAYAEALGAYDAAVNHPGDRPREDAIRRRVLGAAREREVLRLAPIADLLAAKDRASRVEDPAAAAEEWERALELARGMTGLEWPGGGDGFHLDSRSLREHAAACAESAIDHRQIAGRRWMAAGDRVAEGERTDEARQAYERAKIHLERALALSRELFPGRIDALEETMADLQDRLAGEAIPAPEEALDVPLPAESLEDIAPGTAPEPGDTPPPTAADAEGTTETAPETAAETAPEPGRQETISDPEPIDSPFQAPPIQPSSREAGAEPVADADADQPSEAAPVEGIETPPEPAPATADEAVDGEHGAEADETPAAGEPAEEPADAESAEEPADAEPASEPADAEPASEPAATDVFGGPPELDDLIGPTEAAEDAAESEPEEVEEPTPAADAPEPMDPHSTDEPAEVVDGETIDAGSPPTEEAESGPVGEEATAPATPPTAPDAQATSDTSAETDPEPAEREPADPEPTAPEEAAVDEPAAASETAEVRDEDLAASEGWEFGRSALSSASQAESGAVATEDQAAGPSGEEDAGIVDAEAVAGGATEGLEEDAERGLSRRIRALDADAFSDLVADLWEARGWSTMSFSASGGAVYDMVAIRDEPAAERLLLWTDHRPDSGTVPGRVVERIAATRDRSEGAERLALVSSGRLTSEARDRAERADIEVTDAEALADAVREAGLDEELPEPS